MKNIIFSDLDGTLINTKSGKTFPESIMDMEFRKDVLERLNKHYEQIECYKALFIVTNQGGIEKGYLRERAFEAKLKYICESLEEYFKYKVHVLGTFCDTNDHNNIYRKPNTSMLNVLIRSANLYREPKENMLMIGDASGKEGQFSNSDKKCAENFGIDYLDVEDFVKQTI